MVRRARTVVWVVAALACVNIAYALGSGATGRIAVVVGRGSTVTEISKDTLRDVYLRRQRVWSDGSRAIPVNLPPDNDVRQRFSDLVLGRSPQDLVAYWNARYFEGIMPPVVISSAAAIRAYLSAQPGAIAYLAEEDVDETCRTLLWLE